MGFEQRNQTRELSPADRALLGLPYGAAEVPNPETVTRQARDSWSALLAFAAVVAASGEDPGAAYAAADQALGLAHLTTAQ